MVKPIPRSRQRHPRQSTNKKVRTPVYNEYKRQRSQRKDLTWTRHKELLSKGYNGQNDFYNCLVGCGVIKLREEDCTKGLYYALSIKLAVCIRDYQQRLWENKERDIDYELRCLQRFIDGHELRRNDYQVTYMEPDGYKRDTDQCQLPFAFLPLEKFIDLKLLVDEFGLDVPIYEDIPGIWVQINPSITIKGIAKKYSKRLFGPIMSLGLNKLSIGHTTFVVELLPYLKHVRTFWLNALQRIKSCILQRQQALAICGILNEDETTYIENEMARIIQDPNIDSANLKMLTSNLLGGLGPFTSNRDTLFNDTVLLSDISHLNHLPDVKTRLRQYINEMKKSKSKDVDDEYETIDQYKLPDDNKSIDNMIQNIRNEFQN